MNQKYILKGIPASPGTVTAKVTIAKNKYEANSIKRGNILVTDITTPDYFFAFKRASAVITDRGGQTSHAAIVCREMGIPCIVYAKNATKILKDNQIITIDGLKGTIYSQDLIKNRKTEKTKNYFLKTKTKLFVNLAIPSMARMVASKDVDGVGVLRAEFILAQIGKHPKQFIVENREQEFINQLSKGVSVICKEFYPRPVIYRFTDFKTNEYANLIGGKIFENKEENPMLGYRGAIRFIKDPEIFNLESEAIYQVRKQFDNLQILIPFIRTPSEIKKVKQLLSKKGLKRGKNLKYWMMVEVPANVICLEKFLDQGVDGISIGSNDLTQLLLGIDRDNGFLGSSYDERDESVLICLEKIIKTARKYKIPVSICGQIASKYPDVTEKLIKWGIDDIGVTPDLICKTRKLIANIEKKLS
jgi:pyruvate,water dikinase